MQNIKLPVRKIVKSTVNTSLSRGH